jgi:xanthine dehydrogenase YagR molybdenum-binding subunit
MANQWPKERRIIGTKVTRIDGPDKATGRAKYSFDINRPGLLHGKILRCPLAHAKLKSLDTTDAEKMPGVKAVHPIAKVGAELNYAGDEVVAIAADTEEHLADALHAVKVEYEPLPFLVKEEDALKDQSKVTLRGGNIQKAGEATVGDYDKAFREADVVVEGTYGVPVISHQCLESHGLVAEWDDNGNLKVWASTQATVGTAQELARHFKIGLAKVQCITHFMGGGFGSKFGAEVQGITCAELAKKAKAPVKLLLDRAEEITTAGNRPSAYGRVKMGASKDGKITTYEVDCYGTPGVGGGATVNFQVLPYIYQPVIPNINKRHLAVRLNIGTNKAMRAPGHPQSCVMTDCCVDDLAAKLDMDPMELRLKNLPPNDPNAIKRDPISLAAVRHTIYTDEIAKAAELSDWKNKWHPPGKGPSKGPVKHGIGMALHTWGGVGVPGNNIRLTISSDGSVLLQCSTQDLGTGEKTVLAIVTAETLGLEVKDITIKVGESQYGPSNGSGGSITTPSTSPVALNASVAVRDALFDNLAVKLGAKKEDLGIEPGKIVDKANNKSWTWKEACARLGMDAVTATAGFTPGLSNQGVGGVQIAEVWVDTETGVVRCTKMVAVQDCGMVINKLCCESQVAGGVIMGVNYALFEEVIFDRTTGRQVNPDMEFYKLGGIEDMPEIVVHLHDMPERGVIGVGEPPTISTCAAIGNAVHNAIGVRVPYAPYTPERVLERLSKRAWYYRVSSHSRPTHDQVLEALAKKGGVV